MMGLNDNAGIWKVKLVLTLSLETNNGYTDSSICDATSRCQKLASHFEKRVVIAERELHGCKLLDSRRRLNWGHPAMFA